MNKAFSIILIVALAVAAMAQGSEDRTSSSKARKPAGTKTASTTAPAQAEPANGSDPTPTPAATPVAADIEVERQRFDAAVAAGTTAEKAGLLRKFLDEFPDSSLREDALTYLITARAVVGNELVRSGNTAGGVASFKLAVDEAPLPVPDRIFTEIIAKIPGSLFDSGQRPAAMELARYIENKVASNPRQLLAIGAFYINVENGSEARRVAEAAISVDPQSAAAYQALGLANRVNFDLDAAAAAYSKAVELDPASAAAKRSLAEMNRALGRSDAAVTMYRDLLALDENDSSARSGLILALFGSGRQKDAEAELAKLVKDDRANFALLTGVAYWYAANDDGDKAVEYAQRAVDAEPRYVWAHIALARGLMKQRKPVDAERVLIRARQYGNFPTLDFAIASARFQSGLYREAVEELKKNFAIIDGRVGAKLGGRILMQESSLQSLVGYERRAGLLQPLSAGDADTSDKLLLLLELDRATEHPSDETRLTALADEFVKGTDNMKLHRQLYVANLLLQKNVAVAKAAELVKESISNVDAGLEVSAPGAAVMASELYESRVIAFARNEMVVIPDVPRKTLSAIVRGRIEELAGWTLYQQQNYPESVIRLKRAVNVLPDKSAWWRSSMWRLGAALQADGKDQEALDSYTRSYVTDRPTGWKYSAIEALYRKVNGSTDGLEAQIGPNPLTASFDPKTIEPPPVEAVQPQPEAAKVPSASEPLPPAALPSSVPVKPDTAGADVAKPASTDVVDTQQANAVPLATADGTSPPNTAPKSSVAADAARPDAPNTAPDPAAEMVAASETKKPETAPELTPPPIVSGNEADKEARKVTELPPSTPAVPAEANEIPAGERVKPIVAEAPIDAVPSPEVAKTETASGSNAHAARSSDEPEVEKLPVERPDDLRPDVGRPIEIGSPSSTNPANPPEFPEIAAPPPPALKDVVVAQEKPSETAQTAQPPVSDLSKIQSVPDAVAGEAPLKPGQPAGDESNAAEGIPADAEPAKAEPVNLLRDPFAGTASEPASSPEANKTAVIVVDDPYKQNTEAGQEKKPVRTRTLFEPVIIKVPASSSAASTASKDATPVASETAPKDSAISRQRIVEGKEITVDKKCSIVVSQESIMLLSGGGSLGVRVNLDDNADVDGITATSSSPQDIEVKPQPAIEGITDRRFFVIKSISDKVGIFQVNFDSPCGKREVAVHVR
ncbi:MAG: tetratricopeptide repeat protein [Pyrinomonadaceae bacterium]